VVKEMLTIELIAILGLLFGLLASGMVAARLGRRPVADVGQEAKAH
jgi:hypothetical protein